MKKIIFSSHKEKQCGVHEYGINVFNNIKDSTLYKFVYVEASSHGEFVDHLRMHPDTSAIIYNYYPSTMPWINQPVLNERGKFAKQFVIVHETATPVFDGYIHIDPTYEENNNHFNTGRPLLLYDGDYPNNKIPRIGSFGFGFGNKGFDILIKTVNEEFDYAHIEILIPFAKFGDENGNSARSLANICNSIPRKDGISLRISHDFLSTKDLLQFLASNDLNAFFYDYSYGRGIGSVLDYALSVKRPIAITQSYQFRHMKNAPIFLEHSSLKTILQNGTAPLEQFYNSWNKENLIKDYERILDRFLE